MLTKDELLTIPGNWVNIEDDKEVVNVTIDEEIEDWGSWEWNFEIE